MFAHLKISLYVSLFCILGACGNGSSAFTSDSINEALDEVALMNHRDPSAVKAPQKPSAFQTRRSAGKVTGRAKQTIACMTSLHSMGMRISLSRIQQAWMTH